MRLQDDFYAAVNADWLKAARIPADRVSVGVSEDLSDAIEKLLMADTKKMRAGEIGKDDPLIGKFARFYDKALDHDRREQDGASPLKPYIAQIDALESLVDYEAVLVEWTKEGRPTFFEQGVMGDFFDARHNALFLGNAPLLLPDPSYYAEDNPTGKELLKTASNMLHKLYALLGFNAEEAAAFAADTLAFDALLVPLTPTSEQAADYANAFCPVDFDDLSEIGGNFGDLVANLIEKTPDKVIVSWKPYFDGLSDVVNEENFHLLKSWLKSQMLMMAATYLSREYYETASVLNMAISGQTAFRDQAKIDYTLASAAFAEVIGDYYGRNYFGETAKRDVESIAKNIIEVYKKRIAEKEWLSDKTRETAIKKLNTLTVRIGYPDLVPAYFSRIEIKESASLLEAAFHVTAIKTEDVLSQWGKEVDLRFWPEMAATEVNAYYQPINHAITFPAAILQSPYYSLEQSASANYGAIGYIIGHEISHAFDTNGALFDENGNKSNWWTEADYANFEKRTQAMVDQFEGIDYAGGQVNGKLTVSENVADLGGLRSAIEVLKTLPERDFAEFFRSYALSNVRLLTPQTEAMKLITNVHAPEKLRVNVQVPNFDEFIEAFDVKESDGMWRAPEERISIW